MGKEENPLVSLLHWGRPAEGGLREAESCLDSQKPYGGLISEALNVPTTPTRVSVCLPGSACLSFHGVSHLKLYWKAGWISESHKRAEFIFQLNPS